jgi:hypothetical protein
MAEMTESEWSTKYRPIKNHLVSDDTTSFETYGEELDFVTQQPNSTVWTEMDGDNGVYIVQGYHLANRISYYVTEIPWQDDDDICITICEFVTCHCYNEDTDEANPDCEDCYGEGNYTDWKD